MWRNLLVLAVVVMASVGVAWWMSLQQPTAPTPSQGEAMADKLPVVANLAPDFHFSTIEGEEYSLRDLKGKGVVLNFWASWCVPCVTEFPALLALAAREQGRLVLLAVSVDHDRTAMEKFLAKMREDHADLYPATTVLVVHDVKKAIAQDLFQTIKYPETILIGADQGMREKIAGEVDWLGEAMKPRLAAILPAAQ
jgi:thiol-disulfide isomerase/thioredoxin